MSAYENTKGFTGLDVDNRLERASCAAVFQSGTSFTSGSFLFGKIEGSETNMVSCDSGLRTAGLLSLYTATDGTVTPLYSVFDASTSIVINNTGSGYVSIPTGFTSWYNNHQNNIIGCGIKFTLKDIIYVANIIGQTGNYVNGLLSDSVNQYRFSFYFNFTSQRIQYNIGKIVDGDSMLPLSAGSSSQLLGDLYLFATNGKRKIVGNATAIDLVNGRSSLSVSDQNSITFISHSYKDGTDKMGYLQLPVGDESSETAYSTVATREWTTTQIETGLANNYLTLENMKQILNEVGRVVGFTCDSVTKDSEGTCTTVLSDNGTSIIRVSQPEA